MLIYTAGTSVRTFDVLEKFTNRENFTKSRVRSYFRQIANQQFVHFRILKLFYLLNLKVIMALYSQEETVLIFKRCAAAPPSDIKFKKFERLGVLMSKDEPAANEEGVQANSCSVCRKVLPSAHLLDLHISENHDNYFEVKKEKQPMVRQRLPPKLVLMTFF